MLGLVEGELEAELEGDGEEEGDELADVEGLELFDSVIVKLVMKSINKAKVPRIKNFRVIAVAA